MIQWQLFETTKPLEHEKHYLVSDGRYVDVGFWANYCEEPKMYVPDRCAFHESEIVYYAEINLPISEVTS